MSTHRDAEDTRELIKVLRGELAEARRLHKAETGNAMCVLARLREEVAHSDELEGELAEARAAQADMLGRVALAAADIDDEATQIEAVYTAELESANDRVLRGASVAKLNYETIKRLTGELTEARRLLGDARNRLASGVARAPIDRFLAAPGVAAAEPTREHACKNCSGTGIAGCPKCAGSGDSRPTPHVGDAAEEFVTALPATPVAETLPRLTVPMSTTSLPATVAMPAPTAETVGPRVEGASTK